MSLSSINKFKSVFLCLSVLVASNAYATKTTTNGDGTKTIKVNCGDLNGDGMYCGECNNPGKSNCCTASTTTTCDVVSALVRPKTTNQAGGIKTNAGVQATQPVPTKAPIPKAATTNIRR